MGSTIGWLMHLLPTRKFKALALEAFLVHRCYRKYQVNFPYPHTWRQQSTPAIPPRISFKVILCIGDTQGALVLLSWVDIMWTSKNSLSAPLLLHQPTHWAALSFRPSKEFFPSLSGGKHLLHYLLGMWYWHWGYRRPKGSSTPGWRHWLIAEKMQ